MSGIPFNLAVEVAVAVLLAFTIGYCIILNSRLKRLHADRAALSQMIADLVNATDLANTAIHELKEVAQEADLTLGARLEESEKFAIELANHVTSGQAVLDRITRITEATRQPAGQENGAAAPKLETNRAKAALEKLRAHQQSKESAA